MPDDQKTLISLDNRGEIKTVTLKTVNTSEFFTVALGYVRFLEEIAENLNFPLTFSGVEVKEGSAAAVLYPSDPKSLLLVEPTALRLVTGREQPSKELEPVLARFQKALQVVPSDHLVSVVTSQHQTVVIEPLQKESTRRAVERTSFYGQLITVGGKGRPQARFFAERLGTYLIPLYLSRDQAPVLGAHLYKTLFVEAELERDPSNGDILGGTLLKFKELDGAKSESVSRWREWFAATVKTLPDFDEMMRARHSDDPEVE